MDSMFRQQQLPVSDDNEGRSELYGNSKHLSSSAAAVFISPKMQIIADVIRQRLNRPVKRALVVGCGSGQEAAALAQSLQAEVVGIDIEPKFDPLAAQYAELRQG